MITDQDVEKLKGTFVTKDDLHRVEHKVDGLEARFDGLETRVDSIEEKIDGLTEEVGDLKMTMGELNDKMDSLHNKLDRFTGTVDAVQVDNAAGAQILARHGRQIKELALHTGATISD